MFFRPEEYPMLGEIASHWRDILAEYRGVQGELERYMDWNLAPPGWDVYGLFDFPSREPIPDHIAKCPLTAKLLDRYLPGHGTAGFSVLAPGLEIEPHEGAQSVFLRAHLGLSIPEGDCGLRVQLAQRRWTEGAWIVFDDRLEHCAWNRTQSPRVVLLVDILPRKELSA
jgi:ornithine lipid ester-linked acyl 2-hydroxylase